LDISDLRFALQRSAGSCVAQGAAPPDPRHLQGCRTARIEAESPGAHRSHVEQATRDREVLEKVDCLVLVGEVAVKEDRSSNGKKPEHCGSSTGLESDQQEQSAADFDDQRDGI